MPKNIKIKTINQLSDNYSYIIYSLNLNKAIVVDPSDSFPIIEFLEKNNLSLQGILITHHHSDHTSGIKKLLNFKKTEVYSPNSKIIETTKLINNKDIINFKFINFKVMATPGHTLDHVVFYSKNNNLLFSGDVLFSLGCGRIFEGNHEQMFKSLQNLNELPDETIVYCGHEYTYKNYKFLKSVFKNYEILNKYIDKIDYRLKNTKLTVPFRLGDEKIVNPFLVSQENIYNNFIKTNNFDKLNFFKHLRNLKDNY